MTALEQALERARASEYIASVWLARAYSRASLAYSIAIEKADDALKQALEKANDDHAVAVEEARVAFTRAAEAGTP